MNGFVVGSHAGFLEGFTEGGVGMASSADVFSGCSVFHAEDAFSDHFSGIGADDVDAEDLVGFFVSEDFDDSFGFVVGPGTGVGHEGEGALVVFLAFLLQFFLSLAH